MTRFTDGNKTIEITMRKLTGSGYAPDWSADFFGVGTLHYDEEKDAYKFLDVEYLIEILVDYMDGVGDFASVKADENEYAWIEYVDGKISEASKSVVEGAESKDRIILC